MLRMTSLPLGLAVVSTAMPYLARVLGSWVLM